MAGILGTQDCARRLLSPEGVLRGWKSLHGGVKADTETIALGVGACNHVSSKGDPRAHVRVLIQTKLAVEQSVALRHLTTI